MSSTWTKLSPSVRGIAELIWAMTVVAWRMAVGMAMTDVPSEQKPCLSGTETLTSTASMGRMPRLMSVGTSDRKTGTYSARPSLTAARALGPMNNARWRKWPAISGARWGPGPSVWKCRILTSVSSCARATRASSRTDGVAAAEWMYSCSPDLMPATASAAVTMRIVRFLLGLPCWWTDLVRLVNDEHRHVAVRGHGRRDRAHERALEPAPAVSTEHDQAEAAVPGELGDSLRRAALKHVGAGDRRARLSGEPAGLFH